jgi:hypothetical protein
MGNSAMKMAIKTAVKKRLEQNSLKYPKNNYFCYRWRVVDEFNKQIDRDMYQMRVFGGDFHQSLINEKVLSTFKTAKLKTNADFMQRIMADAVDFMENRRKTQSEATKIDNTYTESMRAVLQGMFDILLSCSIEFNTRLGFSELFIASTEPEMVTFNTANSKTASLRARFSTSQFSLVIHGYKNEIKFFIMPVEDLIGLTTVGIGRTPFLSLTAELEGEGVVWYAEDQLLTEDLAERVCLETLKELIEQTEVVLSSVFSEY